MMIRDPLARMDQMAAAFGTQAEMLATFRDRLIRYGFDQEHAAELVTVWYEHMLQAAAIQHHLGDGP